MSVKFYINYDKTVVWIIEHNLQAEWQLFNNYKLIIHQSEIILHMGLQLCPELATHAHTSINHL